MMELNVTLEFACSGCAQAVGVTLKCEGKALASDLRAVATVNVPCPTCGMINRLVFEPSGRVHGVSPCAASRPVPEPSLN
jgi:hypothetical protein